MNERRASGATFAVRAVVHGVTAVIVDTEQLEAPTLAVPHLDLVSPQR